MKKKNRIKIPGDTASEILFLSDRTCCVCTIRGKSIQIHHIDENPANNAIENLSVLCLECHNDTMTKGGFGRKLDATQVLKFKEEWINRVRIRKEKADELASIKSVMFSNENTETIDLETEDFLNYKTYENPKILKDYLDKILVIKNAQLTISQMKWDTGNTMTMNEGTSNIIDFYEEVLIELSTFYPKGHFEKQHPREYISKLIANRFSWHRHILEPKGIGSGGTIISIMAGGNVMEDLQYMVAEMANSLLNPIELDECQNFDDWKEEWID